MTYVITSVMTYSVQSETWGRGRLPKPVRLKVTPPITAFNPSGSQENLQPIYLEPAELEAFRLVDLEGLSQEEAGEKMGVSRGTIWRLLENARKKTAQALTEGRPISITPSSTEANQQL